ncbi:MAG: zinc ABC transporter substrate-binding protein [Bdellovibrionales bacterium]|nr:zinc ABC transporter substrate-binding protein [Bdellovibrionales bacterium]
MKNFILLLSLFSFAQTSLAKLNVVTTETDLKAIVDEVGKDFVKTESIGKGTQDPHYVEAKPSFMVKVHKADLIVAVGLDLEIGWLPSILRGARNPKVLKGQKGYLEVGPLLDPLEVPSGKVSRAEGDVHPYGNPHFWLDPLRAGKSATIIADRLSELDPTHKESFQANAKNFLTRMTQKTKEWEGRLSKTGVKSVVTYHKTLTYFLSRFQIKNPVILEPKPGLPPTSAHIMKVIQEIKSQKIPLILVENFFDPSITKKILHDVPNVKTEEVAVSVGGAQGINSLDDLYEQLVTAIEKGGQ